MKEKVIKLLIKWGNNEHVAADLVEKNLDYVVKTYPDAKPSQVAKIIRVL